MTSDLNRFEAARQMALLMEAKRSGIDPNTLPALRPQAKAKPTFQPKPRPNQEALDVLGEAMDEYAGNMTAYRDHLCIQAMARCESPIEQMMFAALAWVDMPIFGSGGAMSELLMIHNVDEDAFLAQGQPFARLLLQHPLDKYRVDFLVRAAFHGRDPTDLLVIECDGHDYHERTKQQAQRDRGRDRFMQASGLRVFRFTGSEIWRDPHACAEEVRKFIFDYEYRTRPEGQ